MKLILASRSPRRIQRLKEEGYSAETRPSDIDEDLSLYFDSETLAMHKKSSPWTLCETLAKKKAEKITLRKGEWVISCDTIVWMAGELFEKPKDHADAVRMLSTFSGKEHVVYSGYCIKSLDFEVCGHGETKVCCNSLSEGEICDYIRDFPPFDKAGAYGIQDGVVVSEIVGDYNNVMGFPDEILQKLKVLEEELYGKN